MRKAEVRRYMNVANDMRGPDTVYKVDLFEDNEYVGTIDPGNKSSYYIDDIVENWETGILNENNKYIRKEGR